MQCDYLRGFMYSKQQASQLRQEFWTTFGHYMAPQLSAEGEKINWVNYKTGERHIHFKMITENRMAGIAIVLDHPDDGLRELFFEQFAEVKHLLHAAVGEIWDWELHTTDAWGKNTSSISRALEAVSVFNKADWPALISFFKPRLIALDDFWCTAKYAFESLH